MGVNWNKLKKHEKYQENFGSQINNTNNIVQNVQARTENILNNKISNTSIILNANKNKSNNVNSNIKNSTSTPFMVNKTSKLLEQRKTQDTIQNDLTNGFRNTRQLYDFSKDGIEDTGNKNSSILNQIGTSAKKTVISIPTAIENVSNNTFDSYKKTSASKGYIANKRKFNEELQSGNKNAELPKKENKVLSGLNERLDEYNEQIQNNIQNAENPFKKKVQQLIPSTVNSLAGAGMSAINPGLGMATFGATAYSDYYKDGQTRGMNDKQANKYAMLMSYWESLGDTLITGGQVSNIKKAFSGKALSRGIVDSFSMNVLEGAIQEGITEPVNELVAGITGGKDKIDMTDMHNRILESAFDGALQEIFMGGMTAGLLKTGQAVNKIQNGEKLSNREIKEVIEENIKSRGKEQVEKELKQGSKNILNQAQVNEIIDNSKLDDESKASLQRVSQKNGWTSEEVQKLIDDRKNQPSTIENKPVLENNQQVIQDDSEMAENTKSPQKTVNEYEKILNNAKFIPENEKQSLLKDAEGTSIEDFKYFVEQENNVYKEQDNDILNTNKTYSNGRKETYTKYMSAQNEYDTRAIEKAKDTIQGSKRAGGRRTKEQWLQVADMLGTEIADKSNSEIEEIAYRTWQDERPNAKSSINRQGQNYVAFNSDEWINQVYNAVKKARGENITNTSYSVDTNQTTQDNKQLVPIQQVTSEDTLTSSARKYGLKYKDMSIITVKKALDNRGVKSRFDESVFSNKSEGAQYIYDKNNKVREIIFNPNANEKTIIQEMAVHELTHDIITSNTEISQNLKKDVLDWVKKDAEYENQRKSVEETYKKIYLDMDHNSQEFQDIIDEEVVAKTLQTKLGTQEEINRLVKENRNVAQRIYDFVVEKIKDFKNRKNAEYRFWKDIRDKFEKAYNNKEFNPKENNTSKFAKVNDLKHGEYWEIEDSKDLFNGMTDKKSLQNKAYDYLLKGNENFEIINDKIDGKNVEFRRISAKEYVYGRNNNKLQGNQYQEKMRMAPSINDLIENAPITYHSPLTHKNKLFPNGFNNYQGKVGIDNDIFRYLVRIGKDKNDGSVFYDISLELLGQKNKANNKVLGAKSSSLKSALSTNSITSSNKNVNATTNNYMQNNKKYSNNSNFDEYISDRIGKEGTRTTLGELREIKLPERPRLPEKKNNNAKYSKIVDEVYKEDINEGKTRKHYQSIFESDQIGETGKEVAKELYKTDTYTPISNASTLATVNDDIARNGLDRTYDAFMYKLGTNQKVSLNDIATGERLIQIYSQNGDVAKVNDLIQNVAILGTELGQQVQALSLIKKASPEGQLQLLHKMVERTNIKENTDIKITDDMAEQILQSRNQEELQENIADIAEAVANDLPLKTSDKIRSWRYLSMLGNPRTHIRNLVANLAMNLTQNGKNLVAGGMEDIASVFNKELERTKTLRRSNNDQKTFAKQDAEMMQDMIDGGGKYDIKNIVQSSQRSFDNRVLNAIAEFNSNRLDKEDKIFLKLAYKQAMQGYMTANNLKSSDMTGEVLEKARQYASVQAQEATFHQFSEFAQQISRIENSGGIKGVAVGALLPFKKTPINIAKSGFQYSPAGVLQSIGGTIKDITKTTQDLKTKLEQGKITQKQYKSETSKLVTNRIDQMAKGLTGTSIALLGYALAKSGILKAGNDGEDDEFDSELGNQEYSIKIGDNTYTLDWISPSAMPLFVGATAHDLISGDMTDKGVNAVVTALAKSFEPMTEMSMIQGLTSAISSYEQGSSNMVFDIATSASTSYAGQFIPTILKQVTKTIDPYVRDTTSTKKGIAKKVDQFTRQTMAGIPGLSNLLPVKQDIWGQDKIRADNAIQRFLEVGVLPYNREKIQEDMTNEQLKKVFNETGEKKVLPTRPDKKLKINGEDYTLTSEEYANAKKQYGSTSKSMLDKLIKTNEFKNMTDTQKVKAIDEVYSYAKEELKTTYSKNNSLNYKSDDKLYNTIKELKDNRQNVISYINYSISTKDLEKDSEKVNYLKNMNISNRERKIIYENTIGSKDETYNAMKVISSGIDIDSYLDYKTTSIEADKDKSGNSIKGSKQQKVIDYINNSNFNNIEREYIAVKEGYEKVLTQVQKNELRQALEINKNNIDSETYESMIKKIK